VKLTTHLHLVPRSKNEWSYTSTPNTLSWRGAQLKEAQRQLYFSILYFTLLYFTLLYFTLLYLTLSKALDNF
jgi:hypothetical protein